MYEHLRAPERWTLPDVLDHQATHRGSDLFVMSTDGDELTYGAARADAAKVAGLFRSAGVEPGAHVAVVLPNSLDFVRVWLGASLAGAVIVPINHALRGSFLSHQLRTARAAVVVGDAAALAEVRAIAPDVPQLETLIDVGTPAPAPEVPGLTVRPFDEWRTAAAGSPASPRGRDTACVMFTSGTTGPSKGVMMPHAHCFLLGLGVVDNLRLRTGDRYYISTPLFHANALFMQLYSTLIAGASAVLAPRFSASGWIDDIRRHRCTVTNTLGALSQFVIDQPERPDDKDHQLRVILPAPNPPEQEAAWRTRFGIPEVVSAYGMTEVNIPLYGRLGESRPGTAGYVYEPYFEVEIHDPDTDEAVPAGSVGEIVVRGKVPFAFSSGYLDQPDKTVEAFRNFWFHTGDSGTMAADGCVTFVDRTKDCIRRRGENISSFELEVALGGHPAIAEVAAYAVPSFPAGTEDEVMLAVVVSDDSIGERDVAAYADEVLPRFARPRYVELVPELPKTPTGRVRKAALRERGVSPRTWDRDGVPS
jgi:crotonobetaine/carnitine-CoA ligase